MGWARLWRSSSQHQSRATRHWRLMYFLGGKDAKAPVLHPPGDVVSQVRGRGVRSSRSIVIRQHRGATQKQLGYEPAIIQQQMANARTRENIGTTWYSEWDRFTQQQIQAVLMRQITPIAALTASAQKAQQLKKEAS